MTAKVIKLEDVKQQREKLIEEQGEWLVCTLCGQIMKGAEFADHVRAHFYSITSSTTEGGD